MFTLPRIRPKSLTSDVCNGFAHNQPMAPVGISRQPSTASRGKCAGGSFAFGYALASAVSAPTPPAQPAPRPQPQDAPCPRRRSRQNRGPATGSRPTLPTSRRPAPSCRPADRPARRSPTPAPSWQPWELDPATQVSGWPPRSLPRADAPETAHTPTPSCRRRTGTSRTSPAAPQPMPHSAESGLHSSTRLLNCGWG